jgi:hypothetical protein
MLTDPTEIAIIAGARQANVRDPKRSRAHFSNVCADFFADVPLDGARVLDLGPGQFDLAVVLAERGAQTVGVDNDPAVLALGRHRGLQVVDANLKALHELRFDAPFDGVFCKLSLNAFWFHDEPDLHTRYIAALAALVSAQGWAWIAPWNGVPRHLDPQAPAVAETLAAQDRGFVAAGFRVFEVDEANSRRYGIHGVTANRRLFLRNLRVPARIAAGAIAAPASRGDAVR